MALLFVYGTLLQTNNPFGSYLLNQSTHLRSGRFKGKLFDIGNYPGAIYDPKADTYVYGSLISIHNVDEVFKVLDDYEGFGIDQPQPNEFTRELIEIESSTERLQCWVYLYNLSVTGLFDISSGNYNQYISKKGQKKSPE